MRATLQIGLLVFLNLVLLLRPPVSRAATQGGLDQLLDSAEDRFRKGDLPGAEKILLSAEKTNPRSFVVRNNLGALYLQLRRYADAVREFSAAAALNPRSPDAVRGLGTVYFLSGDYAAALKPLERAKELDPRDLRTRYQRGYALLMLNRPEEARPELAEFGEILAERVGRVHLVVTVGDHDQRVLQAGIGHPLAQQPA